MPLDVHPHRPGLDGAADQIVGVHAAAQDRADAGHQFARGERLGHVVVGTEFEPDDLVDLAVARGDDDDRDVRALTQRAAHLGAGQARQHQVEQHQVGAVAIEDGQRVEAGAGDRDLVALAPQHVGQRVGERLLVLDDEHSGHQATVPLTIGAAARAGSGGGHDDDAVPM